MVTGDVVVGGAIVASGILVDAAVMTGDVVVVLSNTSCC